VKYAAIPIAVTCDGGSVPIEIGALPSGADVQREDTVLCSQSDARALVNATRGGTMSCSPAKVTY